jgi:thiol:disulfide interchange protein
MRHKIFIFFMLLFFSLSSDRAAFSAVTLPSQGEKMAEGRLVSESATLVAGQKIRLGLLLTPRPGWHTYWENPGDAGLPTTLYWDLPKGFAASEIDWPAPEAISEGPFVVYGYARPVLLPITMNTPGTLSASSYTLKARAEWLVCKEICVPESAELELTLPVAAEATPSEDASLFVEHDARRPARLSDPLTYQRTEEVFTLRIPKSIPGTDGLNAARFFARQNNVLSYAATQTLQETDDAFLLVTKPAAEMPVEPLSGIVSLTYTEGETRFYDVTLQPSSTTIPASTPSAMKGFLTILLLALLGGLILNLMPCVLPVLSLKALTIAKKIDGEKAAVRRQGLAYTLGILVSFAVLAGILIALQQAGEQVGWGYQMQSPAFVGFLVYLLFLVGLNLSGWFELPVLFGSIAVNDQHSARGSFFTGVLATAVATPCTAPFMATAVGVALSLPSWQALLVFEALGFGLALPFLLISFFPRLLKFLPKPGAWMDKLKQLLAVPMYLSVVWLLWVLMQQTGVKGVSLAVLGMVILLAAIKLPNRLLRIALVVVALTGLFMLNRMERFTMLMPGGHIFHGVTTEAFSQTRLEVLRNEGKPVFVDATAAWCITCQVNERVALHTEASMQTFREHGVILMIADWTHRNAEISEWLKSFGYRGVPLYVFYPAGHGKPVVLPQILTKDLVIEAISPSQAEAP